MTSPPHRKKLIEVALPLAEINAASAKEKSIRHGHPSTLHLWWSRKPLATCRAVLFASLVDDPSSDPAFADRSEAEQAAERERLFQIIREMVPWENANNPEILERARAEIRRCCGDEPPPVLDPFCGGGSIPLEAQRLGLEAHGSDLNPVAVLITKALVEIPPRFAGRPPANPEGRRLLRTWDGAEGLAHDVRHYGAWMRTEAERRIGHLYPKATLPKEMGGGEATVIAWLWARTVRCPNPACGAQMPLVSNFVVSSKKGREVWVEPVVEPGAKRVRFEIRHPPGQPPAPAKVGRGAQFRCLVCGNIAGDTHVKAEGMAGRLGQQLMATVAEGQRGRVYVAPTAEQERVAASALPEWRPEQELADDPRNIWCKQYGLTTFGNLFTDRQLVALTTFSDLVGEARERALADAREAGLPDDGVPLEQGGAGAQAYADAVATYLAFALSKMADRGSTLCTWFTERDSTRNTFARQAIPMTWDFAELNTLLTGSGSFEGAAEWTSEALEGVHRALRPGTANQCDARQTPVGLPLVISTDPPYYDNVGYADLSDFFYVWLRRSLSSVYPSLFRTMLAPKDDELIASPYRHDGSKEQAEEYFESGLTAVFAQLRAAQAVDFPLTLFYAFKQREGKRDDAPKENGLASTGWETMLEGLIGSGLAITATWPMRTELANRAGALNANALASSIVLACRPRPADAPEATRREFLAELRRDLQDQIAVLLEANIAPVDLAQAVIGPGLAIYTRHRRVVESDGSPMPVRAALGLINDVLDQILEAHDERLDPDSRFCVAWYEQFGYAAGAFGQADVLARAKGGSVDGLRQAGVVEAQGGKVRILRREELDPGWDPASDPRVPVWEALQHLVRRLETSGVEGAGALLAQVGDETGELTKQLAVRLYEVCDRRKWAGDAFAYNAFAKEYPDIAKAMREEGPRYDNYVREYPEIARSAAEHRRRAAGQTSMF